jgi:hypothetical protein
MKLRATYIVSILALSVVLSGCGAKPTNTESPSPSASAPIPTESTSPEASETPKVTLLEEFKQQALANARADELFGTLKQMIGEAQPTEADEFIRTIEAYYQTNLPLIEEKFAAENVQSALLQATWPFTEDQIPSIEDESIRTLVEQTLMGGYKLETTEGYIFPIVDYSKLLSFGERVSTAMKTYLDLMAMESDGKSTSDGGMVISLDELSRRMLAAESYVATFPDTAERKKVEERYIQYLNNYLIGLNNTPIFDYPSFLIVPEIKAHFEQMVASHGGTVTGKLTQQMLAILGETSDAVFLKDKNGEQINIPVVKTFRDGLEKTARAMLPQMKNK